MDSSQPDPRPPTRALASSQLDASSSSERLARAAQGAEQLCAALWEELREELCYPPADARVTRAAELAGQLAQVCASVAELARRCTPISSEMMGTRAVISEVPAGPLLESPAGSAEISIRDARGEGPAAWVRAVGGRLECYQRDARPFAALLVEVTDAERLSDVEAAEEITRLLARVQTVLRQELRPTDDVTLESPGRWWLTLVQMDAHAARAVGERLVKAIRSLAGDFGLTPRIAIGIASCPEDGHDAASLAAHADVGLYAARVAGRTLPPA